MKKYLRAMMMIIIDHTDSNDFGSDSIQTGSNAVIQYHELRISTFNPESFYEVHIERPVK